MESRPLSSNPARVERLPPGVQFRGESKRSRAFAAMTGRVWARERGAGLPPSVTRTSDFVVRDLHTLLEKARVPPPYVLVGHSIGGIFVRRFATAYPSEVGGLVLVASAHEEQNYKGCQEDYVLSMGAPPPDPFLPAGKHLAWAVDIPVIVIEAGQRPNPQLAARMHEMQLDLARRSPRGELRVAERSGHMIFLDQPDAVVQAIRDVMLSVRSGEQRNPGR